MNSSSAVLASMGKALTDCYEELRLQVTAGPAAHRGFGLALLLREGMAAWMRMCADTGSMTRPLSRSEISAPPAFPGDLRVEAAGILVTMALQSYPGDRA